MLPSEVPLPFESLRFFVENLGERRFPCDTSVDDDSSSFFLAGLIKSGASTPLGFGGKGNSIKTVCRQAGMIGRWLVA